MILWLDLLTYPVHVCWSLLRNLPRFKGPIPLRVLLIKAYHFNWMRISTILKTNERSFCQLHDRVRHIPISKVLWAPLHDSYVWEISSSLFDLHPFLTGCYLSQLRFFGSRLIKIVYNLGHSGWWFFLEFRQNIVYKENPQFRGSKSSIALMRFPPLL